jgi:SAM-dependent methyltransferase
VNVAYWDDLADQWDDKVFSARRCDRHRVVPHTLQRIARRRRGQLVADFGCGPGDFIPLLSRTFERVVAYDQSPKCVELAARRARRLRNVDVVRPPSTLDAWRDRCDVVLCVNVLIHPTRRNRMRTMEQVLQLLRPGGRLVLVVPSIESECLLAEATRGGARNTVRMPRGQRAANIGVLSVVGVPTKHFAAAELRALAAGLGLTDVEVSRVEYSWSSFGLRPIRPAGLRPWDWMLEAKAGPM